MPSLNKVHLIGVVGKDPETRQFGDGGQVCNFTLATSETYTDREGQKQEQTTWHNIVLNGKLANLSQYIHKGSRLYIEGKIRTRSYNTQDGQTRYVTEIIANGLQLLDPRPQQQEQPAPAPQRPAPAPQRPAPRPQRPIPPYPAPDPIPEPTGDIQDIPGNDDWPF